jgi:hypothetical protein
MDVQRARMITCATALGAGLAPSIALAQTSASDDAAAAAGMSIFTLLSSFMCCFYALGAVFVVGSLVLWLIVLIDLLQRTEAEFPSAVAGNANSNEKVMWLIVVLITGFVGALVYYVSVMRKLPRRRGQVPPVPPA